MSATSSNPTLPQQRDAFRSPARSAVDSNRLKVSPYGYRRSISDAGSPKVRNQTLFGLLRRSSSVRDRCRFSLSIIEIWEVSMGAWEIWRLRLLWDPVAYWWKCGVVRKRQATKRFCGSLILSSRPWAWGRFSLLRRWIRDDLRDNAFGWAVGLRQAFCVLGYSGIS